MPFSFGAAKFSSPLLTLCLAVAWACPPVVIAAGSGPSDGVPSAGPDASDVEVVTFESHVAPFIKRYCVGCHGNKKPKARINLGAYVDAVSVVKDRRVWKKVLEAIVHREMPPAKKKRQPSEAEREAIGRWIHAELSNFDCGDEVDPGRVTMRRLNRTEYNNTVRDLLGVNFRPADDFPADDVGYGFDNIGDVLSMPPLLVEKYVEAAERIVDEAVGSELRSKLTPRRYRVETLPTNESASSDVSQTAIAKKESGAEEENAPRIFTAWPDDPSGHEASAREILANFVPRAYRRPVEADELNRLVELFNQSLAAKDSFTAAISVAMTAVLSSPHFLFKVETHSGLEGSEESSPVSDYDLASRLSYFLWSSMPDAELFALAEAGELGKPDVFQAQALRMLVGPRSTAFVENFAGQWLQTRRLAGLSPDPTEFPDFDADLLWSMEQETLLFFESILREDRSILEFIDADFTFLNERLARHYGIEGVESEAFQRVRLENSERGGLLTQASILTLTSNPTRTSPVKRGLWILEQILDDPPPPPPPDVEPLNEEPEAILSGSLRQRMEKHRTKASCAVCHERMDAIGFAFENFDAVGAWRDFDGQFEIDPSGTLPDGRLIQGPADLKRILKGDAEKFARALAAKTLTYALGRGLEYYDKCAVDEIVASLVENDYRFSQLILGVVNAEPFRKRRGGRAES